MKKCLYWHFQIVKMMLGDSMKHKDLFEHILNINSIELMEKFFKDVATEKELQDFSDRLKVAKLLIDGKTYDAISKETKVSSATIARVNRAILYGDGGYRESLELFRKNNADKE